MPAEEKWLLIRNYDLWSHLPPANAINICVPNYLTHEDIARLIGSSRQTVTTLLNELTQQGLLQMNRSEICFPDVYKIQKP